MSACVRVRVCGGAYRDAQDSLSQTRLNAGASRRCFESRWIRQVSEDDPCTARRNDRRKGAVRYRHLLICQVRGTIPLRVRVFVGCHHEPPIHDGIRSNRVGVDWVRHDRRKDA